MKSHRQREQITVWVLTLAALPAIAVAWFCGHRGWALGIGAGFFAVMWLLTFAFRLALPKSQRHRDPRPWHKALFKLGRLLDRITASVPDLQLTREENGRRLWQVERRGEFGVWSAQVDECDGKVVGYWETYLGHYTMAFDCGRARTSKSSPFFSRGYRMEAALDTRKPPSPSEPPA